MHDSMKIARGHNQILKRADTDTKATATDSTTTKASVVTTTASSTTTTSASSATSASTTSSHTTLTPLLGIPTNALNPSSSSSTTSATHASSSSSSAAPKAATTSQVSSSIAPAPASHSDAAPVSSTMFVTTGVAASSTASAVPSSSSGLSSAATGGIIAGCVLAGLAVLIFVIRKTFIRRRQRKRNTWGAGVYPDFNVTEKYGDNSTALDPPPVPEKSTPRTPVWAPPRPVSPNPSTYYVTPPPMSYNNPVADGYNSTSLALSAADAAPAASGWGAGRPPSAVGEPATVRVVYIPSLPDELSVTTGEIVHLVKAFDDGWALCRSIRGEEGVVPLECLDRTMGAGQGTRLSVGYGQQEGNSDWKNMKRISSLSNQQPRY